MHIYLYDGSFDGLLTAYFYAYRDPDVYDICRQSTYQPDLLSQPTVITTQTDKAARITRAVEQKLSAYTMQNLYLLYLSELPYCDLLGLNYLRLCFQQGANINRAKYHPVIRQVEDYRHKVTTELDHMKGFLRFQQIASLVFFARFAPDHNQLPLLQPHLERRFSDQSMIVYDEKRQYALVYDQQHSVMVPFTQADADQLLQGRQDACLLLFRRYFHTISIPERTNPRLQTSYMPHRYCSYMPETQPESSSNNQ